MLIPCLHASCMYLPWLSCTCSGTASRLQLLGSYQYHGSLPALCSYKSICAAAQNCILDVDAAVLACKLRMVHDMHGGVHAPHHSQPRSRVSHPSYQSSQHHSAASGQPAVQSRAVQRPCPWITSGMGSWCRSVPCACMLS